MRTALAACDGQHYRAPRISDLPGRTLPRAATPDGRQPKGSRKRERARREMARIAANVAGLRRDWAEKISTALVTGCDVIAAEKLNTPAMVRKPKPKPDPGKPGEFLPNGAAAKAGLNRGILSSCGGMLARRIEQKAAASAVTAVFATPVSPASSAVCVITPRQRTAITKRSAASPVVTRTTRTSTLRRTYLPGDCCSSHR